MFSTAVSQEIDQVVTLLRDSKSVLFITGAGLSADAGIPTTPVSQSLAVDASLPPGELAQVFNPEVLAREPEQLWKSFAQLERACAQAMPSSGHQVISAMDRHFPVCQVLTQNLDGFHQKAGSRHVLPIHGCLHDLRCCSCEYRCSVTSYEELECLPPACPQCRSPMRPDVVLFGESLLPHSVEYYMREINRRFDLIFVIGTSSQFDYIYNLVLDAINFGDAVVEINPQATQISDFATHRLSLRAGEALTEIWRRFGGTERA